MNETSIRNIIAKSLSNAIEDESHGTVVDVVENNRVWPSDTDVLKAFSIFDQELSGHIPVQQLKAFLLRAQVGGEEEGKKAWLFVVPQIYSVLQWRN